MTHFGLLYKIKIVKKILLIFIEGIFIEDIFMKALNWSHQKKKLQGAGYIWIGAFFNNEVIFKIKVITLQVWMPESDIDQITCRTLVFKNLSCRTVLGTIMVPKSIITRPQKNLSHRGKKNLSLSAIGFPSLSGIHACIKIFVYP